MARKPLTNQSGPEILVEGSGPLFFETQDDGGGDKSAELEFNISYLDRNSGESDQYTVRSEGLDEFDKLRKEVNTIGSQSDVATGKPFELIDPGSQTVSTNAKSFAGLDTGSINVNTRQVGFSGVQATISSTIRTDTS